MKIFKSDIEACQRHIQPETYSMLMERYKKPIDTDKIDFEYLETFDNMFQVYFDGWKIRSQEDFDRLFQKVHMALVPWKVYKLDLSDYPDETTIRIVRAKIFVFPKVGVLPIKGSETKFLVKQIYKRLEERTKGRLIGNAKLVVPNGFGGEDIYKVDRNGCEFTLHLEHRVIDVSNK